MKRPVPPSNFRSRDPDTQVDLRRLRDAWQDLLDWIEAQPSGTVDLSAYDTIAGNNGRYLLRAAADFATFTLKSTPVAADVILLEDSAASGAKKKATLSSLATAIGIASTGSTGLWTPPTSPGAIDMEFDSTTIPAAIKYWDQAASTFRVPSGTTALHGTNVSANNVWADAHTTNGGRASWFRVQVPSITTPQFLIAQSVTPPSDVIYWTRFKYGQGTASPNSPNEYFQLALWADTSGHPDENNRISIGFTSGDVQTNYVLAGVSQGGSGNQGGTFGRYQALPEYFAIEKRNESGTTAYYTWIASADGNNAVCTSRFTSTLTMAWLGWECRGGAGNVTNTAPHRYDIDFIRQTTVMPF